MTIKRGTIKLDRMRIDDPCEGAPYPRTERTAPTFILQSGPYTYHEKFYSKADQLRVIDNAFRFFEQRRKERV